MKTVADITIERDEVGQYWLNFVTVGDEPHESGPWLTLTAALQSASQVIAAELMKDRV